MFGSGVSDNITLDMQVRRAGQLSTVLLLLCGAVLLLVTPASLASHHLLNSVCAAPPAYCSRAIPPQQQQQEVSPNALPTVLSTWLVIVNPVSKLALTLAPVAMAIEVRALEGVAVLVVLGKRTRTLTTPTRCVLTCADLVLTCVLQELLDIKHNSWRFALASATLRTALLAVVVGVAIAVPCELREG
jgi:hypothetical protein